MKSSDPDRPRRVLYLVTSDVSARFLRGQLAFLIEQGFDVSVGTRLSDPPARFDGGVTIHDLPYERRPSPLADLRSVFATLRLIRDTRPKIVNASTPKAGLLGMLSAFVLRVPQRVYVVRGLRFETMTGAGRQVIRLLERLTTACATDVIYNSRSLMAVAERERAVRSGRGVVLAGGSGNGIAIDHYNELPTRDSARRALGLPADADVVGFVGRLVRDKGVVDLVDAFQSTGGRRDRRVLLLVGDFESGDPVPDAARRAIESASNIVHVPWVDDTRAVYPAVDVLAFPSYREGLPNVPLEAQLCGTPVVAYASTGTIDAVYHGAPNEIVPTGDVDALRSAIERRLDDRHIDHIHIDGRRTETTEAGRWVADRFEASKVWRALIDLYGKRERAAA